MILFHTFHRDLVSFCQKLSTVASPPNIIKIIFILPLELLSNYCRFVKAYDRYGRSFIAGNIIINFCSIFVSSIPAL